MKKTQRLFINTFVLVISACAFGAVSCSAEEGNEDSVDEMSQSLVVYDTLPTSGTKTVSVVVNPDEATYLIMSSPSAGSWKFETYGSPGSWGGCLNSPPDFVVYTYWRTSGGSWNEWPGGGSVCYPTSPWSTTLYSGSSNIEYKFDYRAYSYYGQGVYAKFTKL